MIDEPGVAGVERETARYYDREEGREDRPLDPRRIAARDRFVERIGTRRPVLEIGTGPGRDALALTEGGLDVIGLDLSIGHATRAKARGITMVAGSARALPFAAQSIGGLWSMSTLMHIPSAAIDATMREIARVMAPGALVAIGVWGGPDVEHFGDTSTGPRRLFSRRSAERWRSLLELVGRIHEFEEWGDGSTDDDAFRYHLSYVVAYG